MVESKEKCKIMALAILLGICCVLTCYFHLVFSTGVVFTHFFYIPIILASLWWKRKGLVVALFLASFLIFSHFFIRAEPVTGNDLIRAPMFIIVALVTAILSERIAKTQEELREAEERFRTIVETAPSLLLISDAKGNNIYVSPNCEKITGCTQEELSGRTIWWVHEDDMPRAKKVFESTFREGSGGKDFEYKAVKKNGELWYASSSWEPLKDEEGMFYGIVFQTIDVTEHKRAEERIEHLNSVLKAIRTVNQLILAENDRDSLLQKACDALIEALGYDAAWLGFLTDDETFAMVKGSGFKGDVTRFCERVMGGDYPPCIKNALAQREMLLIVDKSGACGDCPLKNTCPGKETAIIRVEHTGRLFGLLVVSLAAAVTAADDEEKKLLKEVAGDIAFALYNMEMEEARKRAEDALKLSEKQLRETKDYLDNVIVSSVDTITVVDMKGIVCDWNKGAEGIMGYTADEVVGTSNKIFFADPEEAGRIMETVLREGELKNYRTTVLNKDKKPVHISMSVALLKDKNGVPIGTVRVSRNITKEVELEERIKEERDNLNLIFESMVDSVYIVSKDYEVEFMNKLLIDEFGDQVGRICYEAFHDREEPCPQCKSAEVMKEKTVRWEWHSRRMNKDYDLIETPLKNIDGTISKLTIFRDITERKRAEEQIKASLREKEVLLREIHHRVKNNLQVVSSLLNMQARAVKDKDAIDMLYESRNRINAMALIHAQLYESRNLSEINMKGFVDGLLRQLLPSYPVKDTKITPIVRVADYPFPISIAVPVGLIVNELLANALKHAFDNREEGKIEVILSASEKGEICLTVSDDGVGLPKGFDINKSETLGLHLVKILVEEQLEGKLEIVSKEGTTFNIEFKIENNGGG
ncbi:MAG: PAS domain S-box protein [Halobacteriota archaeon]